MANPNQPPPGDDNLFAMADQPAAPASPANDPGKCPTCGSLINEETVLCVQCGTNLKTGKVMETKLPDLSPRPQAKPKPSYQPPPPSPWRTILAVLCLGAIGVCTWLFVRTTNESTAMKSSSGKVEAMPAAQSAPEKPLTLADLSPEEQQVYQDIVDDAKKRSKLTGKRWDDWLAKNQQDLFHAAKAQAEAMPPKLRRPPAQSTKKSQ